MQKSEAEELISDIQKRLARCADADYVWYGRLMADARVIIKQIFGDRSDHLDTLKEIKHLYENIAPRTNLSTLLEGLIETMRLELKLSDMFPSDSLSEALIKTFPKSNKIFIVHGHDEAMKQAVARTLEKLNLDPIILHEKPNAGRTIIEKFSNYADVSFAIILLSADDLGYSKDNTFEKAMFRARQNVILELGYFLGKLSRERVIALHAPEKNFEMPSDYSGVLFIPFDNSGQWRFDLVKELQACGFVVDANKLIR